MKTISNLALLVLGLSACGEPPQHLDGRRPQAPPLGSSRELPPGHPPADTGHPPTEAGGVALEDQAFAGTVRLAGGLAAREDGYLFVNVRARGAAAPVLSKKYPVAGAPLEDGARAIPFALDGSDNFMGVPMPDEVELHVMFSSTAFVDGKVAETSVPTENGAAGIEVELSGE